MKSAAFNLAFKVHRNEMPFTEGLLKSVEAKAQEDFIEALNSLAGETKYDVNKLDQLISEAQAGAGGGKSKKVNTQAIEEELEQLKRKRSELNEVIQGLKSKIGALRTSITPGINSGLIVIVGSVISVVLFLLDLGIVTLIMLGITIAAAVFTLIQDLDVLSKQQEEISQKKLKALSDIKKVEQKVDELNEKIHEKKTQLRSAQESSGEEPSNAPPSSARSPVESFLDDDATPPISFSSSDESSPESLL